MVIYTTELVHSHVLLIGGVVWFFCFLTANFVDTQLLVDFMLIQLIVLVNLIDHIDPLCLDLYLCGNCLKYFFSFSFEYDFFPLFGYFRIYILLISFRYCCCYKCGAYLLVLCSYYWKNKRFIRIMRKIVRVVLLRYSKFL